LIIDNVLAESESGCCMISPVIFFSTFNFLRKVRVFPNVALNIFVSSVMMGLPRNQHQLARPTNKEALDWYKLNLKNRKVSEEATNSEAVVFFNLPKDKVTISKAKFKKDIES
jgi:hypothetical protein